MSQMTGNFRPAWMGPEPKELPGPDVVPSADGSMQIAGEDPGYVGTLWKGQVSSQINGGVISAVAGSIMSPFQNIEARGAPQKIFGGILDQMKFSDPSIKDLSGTLSSIEKDNTKTGKDWMAAMPKDFEQILKDLDVNPTKLDTPADIFAYDLKNAMASAVYNRDVANGSLNRSGAGLMLGGLGLGLVTDPTTLLSAGIGHMASAAASKSAGGLVTRKMLANLGAQTGLQVGQSIESDIRRDAGAERLGIEQGRATPSEIAAHALWTAGETAAIGFGIHSLFYYGAMGVNGLKKSTSAQALDIANALVSNPKALTEQDYTDFHFMASAGRKLNLPQQGEIAATIINATYGTTFDHTSWDWPALDAAGINPIDIAFDVLNQGYSGKQIVDKMNLAQAVLDDAAKVHTASPVTPVAAEVAGSTPTVTKPLMPIKGPLPKDVTDAGFMWGPRGEIIPDPNFVRPATTAGTPATPVAPVSPVTAPVPVKQPLLADHVPDVTIVAAREDIQAFGLEYYAATNQLDREKLLSAFLKENPDKATAAIVKDFVKLVTEADRNPMVTAKDRQSDTLTKDVGNAAATREVINPVHAFLDQMKSFQDRERNATAKVEAPAKPTAKPATKASTVPPIYDKTKRLETRLAAAKDFDQFQRLLDNFILKNSDGGSKEDAAKAWLNSDLVQADIENIKKNFQVYKDLAMGKEAPKVPEAPAVPVVAEAAPVVSTVFKKSLGSSKEDLMAQMKSRGLPEGTLIPFDYSSRTMGTADKPRKNPPMVEIPNLKNRLIWMYNNRSPHPTVEHSFELLNHFYGMTRNAIKEANSAMKKAVPESLGRNLDRVRITQNADGGYVAELLGIAKDPNLAPKKTSIKEAVPADGGPSDRVKNYIKNRNDAVQRRLDAEVNKQTPATPVAPVASAAPKDLSSLGAQIDAALAEGEARQAKIDALGTKEDPFSKKEGLNPDANLKYQELVRNGSLKQAHELLSRELVGDGHYADILKLSADSMVARDKMDHAIRAGDEEKMNEAKKAFDKINSDLAKRKESLFAMSSTTMGRIKIASIQAANGPITRFMLATANEPSRSLYVEPLGTNDRSVPPEIMLKYDRAFAQMDPNALAYKIDNNLGTGFWSRQVDNLIHANSALGLQTDTGKLLTEKRPLLSQLVNILSPSRLPTATELGSTKMSPSLESMRHLAEREGHGVVDATIDKLYEVGVHRDSPEFIRAMQDARKERLAGAQLSTTQNREAVDILLSEFFPYFDKVGQQALSIGKINEYDSSYLRITTNQEALHNIDTVAKSFFDAAVEHFSKDESVIHKATLKSISTKVVEDADGKAPKTLKDLKALDPDLANQYLKALSGPDMEKFSSRMIRTRMSLAVPDDHAILRDAETYMNSGLGKSIDESILLDRRMEPFIENDPANIMEEYNKNYRYYVDRQEVADRFIENLTGQRIPGGTLSDLLDYFQAKEIEASPKDTASITAFFDAFRRKEAQLAGRRTSHVDRGLLADSVLVLASAPIQSAVAIGGTFTSMIPESVKSVVSAVMTGVHGAGGERTAIETIGSILKSMTKQELYGAHDAFNNRHSYGSLQEIDGTHNNYVSGGYLRNKLNLLAQPFKNFGKAVGNIGNESMSKSVRTHNVATATAAAIVEPVRQIAHIEDINSMNIRGYMAQGKFAIASELESFLKNPEKYLKETKPNEIRSRMEQAGLYSPEARKGMEAILKVHKGLFGKDFDFSDVADAVMKIKESNASNSEFKAAQTFFNSYWDAANQFTNSRIMGRPKLFDKADASWSPPMNRLFNTFAGYSRWFFSRNMLQNFPNSSVAKTAGLIGWHLTAEASSMMIRDTLADFDKPRKIYDGLDGSSATDYLAKAALRVPLMGQLMNGTGSAISGIHDLAVSNPKDKWNAGYGRSSIYSGEVYYNAVKEIVKMSKGENYEFDKMRKAIPYLNAPVFGGLLKAAGIEETPKPKSR